MGRIENSAIAIIQTAKREFDGDLNPHSMVSYKPYSFAVRPKIYVFIEFFSEPGIAIKNSFKPDFLPHFAEYGANIGAV